MVVGYIFIGLLLVVHGKQIDQNNEIIDLETHVSRKLQTCDELCEVCLFDLCFECIENYAFFFNVCTCKSVFVGGYDQNCQPCDENCRDCNAESCLNCYVGAFLDSTTGMCKPCIDNCQQCTAASTCNTCISGFFFNESTSSCELCVVEDCYTCSDANTCTSCLEGFSLSNNDCEPCPNGCFTCDLTSTLCLVCNNGFLYSNGACVPCVENCLFCSDETTCDFCQPGYYLSDNRKCEEGFDCAYYWFGLLCVSCFDGYYLQDYNCIPCDEHCKKCNFGYCYECDDGYTLDENYSCPGLSCDLSCESCDAEGLCQCAPGAFVTTMNTCELCPSLCSACDANGCSLCVPNASQDPCECDTGFFEENNACLQCSDHCVECNNATPCTLCEDGFEIDFDTGSCAYICDSSCESCDTDFICICPSGEYRTSENKCESCMSDCAECSTPSMCTKCDDGFGLLVGKCLPCAQHCGECSTPFMCTECENGFGVANGRCLPCTGYCLECSDGGCDVCEVGYYLSQGNNGHGNGNNGAKCLPCSSSCLECVSDQECKRCDGKHKLRNKKCI